MLNAARAQGRPMMVMASRIAAMTQPAAIQIPPVTIQRTLRRSRMKDIGSDLPDGNGYGTTHLGTNPFGHHPSDCRSFHGSWLSWPSSLPVSTTYCSYDH